MTDDEQGSSNRKHLRESDYKADDEDSDGRSHPNEKKSKRYIIVSDEEEEPDELEGDWNWDLEYNPFFDEPLFRDLIKTQKEVAQRPPMKKVESIESNSKEKPPEEIGQPFKEINKDDGFVEEDWYKSRGTDS